MRRIAALVLLVVACAVPCRAQEIEPRAYSNAPVGVNFFITGLVGTRGDLVFNTLPITNAKIDTANALLAYGRVLNIGGKSAKFDVIVPYTWLDGSAEYQGGPIARVVDGFADPRFRLSVNLFGAPALKVKDFKAYKQDVIVGVSLQVSAPWGQYDPERLVNIGTKRWFVKPEVGVSKAVGHWTFEGKAAATFFSDNDDFFGGNEREQDVIYTLQAHSIRGFKSGTWAALDLSYLTGGRTTINGTRSDDLQENWRVGCTVALPLAKKHSIKINASSGVSSRTGNDYDLLGVAWQYRWGGGP